MSNSLIETNKPQSKVDSKYRKIYRAMIEKSNQLDDIYKSSNAFQKIFQSETTLQREKFKSITIKSSKNIILLIQFF